MPKVGGFPDYKLNWNCFCCLLFLISGVTCWPIILSSCTINTWQYVSFLRIAWGHDLIELGIRILVHFCILLHLSNFTSTTQLKWSKMYHPVILDWCISWIGKHWGFFFGPLFFETTLSSGESPESLDLDGWGILRLTNLVHQEYPRIMNAEWYPNFLIDFPTHINLRLVARSWKRWSVSSSTEGGLGSMLVCNSASWQTLEP